MALRLLLLMSALGVTHLPVVTCPEEENRPIHPCQGVDHDDMSSNLPCIKKETFYNGKGSATRQIDIRMGLPQLMQVLNNSQNMQIKNGDLTIANAKVIVNNDHAAGFREKWNIAISVEVDQKHGVLEHFLRYTVTVRNPDYSDEYRFRLVFGIDGFSFYTESKIWFPKDSQDSAPTTPITTVADPKTEPSTPTMTTPITVTPLESECLSRHEFYEAIGHQNIMIGIVMVTVSVILVLLVLLVYDSPNMLRYFKSKIHLPN